MALTATMYRFDVDLSDVDRNVYAKLELRAAQHPSETASYMLTRVLAYCLCYEDGITFSRGLAVAEEPAVWIKDPQGNTRVWIEVGSPAAARLRKASKAVPRVVVFTHHDVELLKKAVRGERIHRVEAIEVYALDADFLAALEATLDRSNAWSLARSDGEIYLTAGDRTFSTRLRQHSLSALETQ